MKAKELELLLEKYHRGECSAAEVELLHSYLDQLDRQDIIAEDKQQRLLLQVKGRINKQIVLANQTPSNVLPLYTKWAAVAAVMLICFTLLILQNINQTESSNYTVAGITRAGQLKKLVLPDGSTVWLNAASKIQVRTDFNTERRDVTLEGEAFFEVAKNKHKPFIIHTGALQTRVLGTSFNVQAYHTSANIDVTLKTGKVWISAGGRQQAILLPGNIISYQKGSRHLGAVQKVLTQNADSWKTGKLVFNDANMQEVAERLSRAYDLHILVKSPSIRSSQINGEFDMRQAPQEVLDNICHLVGANYKREGKKITIE